MQDITPNTKIRCVESWIFFQVAGRQKQRPPHMAKGCIGKHHDSVFFSSAMMASASAKEATRPEWRALCLTVLWARSARPTLDLLCLRVALRAALRASVATISLARAVLEKGLSFCIMLRFLRGFFFVLSWRRTEVLIARSLD